MLLVLLVVPLASQPLAPAPADEASILASFELRNIGPFRPGSWITAIAVPEIPAAEARSPHRYTFYIGARNGGVWKTDNLGTTFENTTDPYGISAVGSLAVAPSDPSVIWLGTGDAENARSSYSGNGIWRSTDAGETWQHRGLTDSHHIARIVVHPEEPGTAWVAAMGHLFSTNDQRGVFRTRDGGETWQKILALGPEVGVIDLVGNPQEPEVLYAASYDKVRLPWHFEAGGHRSRIHRSRDGGDTWKLLSRGLPQGVLGRIGLDIHRADPDILYAIIENLEASDDKDEDGNVLPFGNQVYQSENGGESWRRVSPDGVSIGSKSAYAFNEIRVDPRDSSKVYVLSESLLSSFDGGESWNDLEWPPQTLFASIFGDVRAFWIDPYDPRRMILGSDGGVFLTWDGGKTADSLHNLPLGEVYAVAVDLEQPYNVYAGLQDHEVWRGPVNSWSGAVTLEDWVVTGKWDGMYTQVTPDGRYAYSTTQFGNHIRADLRLGVRSEIEPEPTDGDGEYRFTWTPPIQISPHDPDLLWAGAQVLLSSTDRGESWTVRSPDLTTNDEAKIAGKGHIRYCTITTLAESAKAPGSLWVGTDDGRVWRTPDAGGEWIELSQALAVAGAPTALSDTPRWTSRVVPSAHAPERAYVTFSGYRRDDMTPYVLRTDDNGITWKMITAGLPTAAVSVLVEDPKNPNLLFVGHDRGVSASLDGGTTWSPFGRLPTVPVRDLLVHPREADLVVGTYGRGVWVGDIGVARELDATLFEKAVHLFAIEAKPTRLTERDSWGDHELYGDRHIEVPNEPDGLLIHYWLGADLEKPPRIRIRRAERADLGLDDLAALEGESQRGLHQIHWDSRTAKTGAIEVVLEAGADIQRQYTWLLDPPPMPVNPRLAPERP